MTRERKRIRWLRPRLVSALGYPTRARKSRNEKGGCYAVVYAVAHRDNIREFSEYYCPRWAGKRK